MKRVCILIATLTSFGTSVSRKYFRIVIVEPIFFSTKKKEKKTKKTYEIYFETSNHTRSPYGNVSLCSLLQFVNNFKISKRPLAHKTWPGYATQKAVCVISLCIVLAVSCQIRSREKQIWGFLILFLTAGHSLQQL